MDNNNYDSQRPRKRITKETARKRQLAALCIIAFLVLLFIILIAKACSGSPKNKGNSKPSDTTTTAATVTTTEPITTEITTTTVTDPVNESDFVLDKTSVYIEVGESDMPRVQGYPAGSTEADERWSSSDTSIAIVDGLGNITGVSPGTCYVTLSSAADPTQEVQIKVVVAGDASYTSTSNSADNPTSTTASVNNTAEAPAPPVYDTEGLTYIDNVLIANKSYSMPSDFAPGLESVCYSQFQALSEAAAKEGLSIWIGSGYRSYQDQEIIYNNYVAMDGVEKADTYSARPGFSEHQTGLVIDCNTIDDAFGQTQEAAWLAEHAHEYGFIIRYPKGKESITGYKYEPWHIRYVGSEVANKVHDSGKCLEELYGIDSYYH